MKKKLRNILMLVLTLVLALQPTMSTYALTELGTPSEAGKKGDGPYVDRFSYGVVGGFSRCTNGDGIKPYLDQGADVSEAIQRYAGNYYMAAEGNKMICWSTENGWTGGWGVGKDGELTEASTVTGNLYAFACQVVADGAQASHPNMFTHYSISSGRYSYWQFNNDPGLKAELVKAAADWDSTYYNLMIAENDDPYLATHPVVWVFETAVHTSDGRVLYPSKLAKQYGVYNQLLTETISGAADGSSIGRPNNVSATAQFFLDHVKSAKWYEFYRLFGININGHCKAECDFQPRAEYMFHELGDGGFELGINGSSVWSLGLSGVKSADQIKGKFEWHMNAEGLNEINHFKEDNAVLVSGPWSAKPIEHIVTSIKQTNLNDWYEWMDRQKTEGLNTYSVAVSTYWAGGNNFTTNYDDINDRRESPHTLSHGTTDNIVVQDNITDSELRSYIQGTANVAWKFKDQPCHILDIPAIGEDRVQIAYKLTARVYNKTKTSWIDLDNSQVHYAIYGSNSDKTYIYNQALTMPKSQVKEGETGLGSEVFEAMSGTPTTNNLFISQGGEQYLVQMQYRFVNDDYVRKYQIKSKADYPNFMYYKATPDSGSKSGSASKSEGSPHSGTSHTWSWNESDFLAANKSTFEAGRDALASALSNLSIDNNWGAAADYTSYDICMPQKGNSTREDLVKEIKALTYNNQQSQSFSKSIVLAQVANDLDSEITNGKVTATVSLSFSDNYGTDCPTSHVCDSDCTDTDGDGSKDSHSGDNRRKCHHWVSPKCSWSITISYDKFVKSPKNLSYNNDMLVTYQNVRYLDIVECHVYQMMEGRQIGLKPILAEPADEIIKATVDRMGYVFYDSTSTGSYKWDDTKKHWYAMSKSDASDLARTGRLLNSFNNRSVQVSLPGGASYEWQAGNDLDHVLIEYDIANGGRSNYSVNAFFAQLIGYLFYDDNLKPRTNCLYVTSDMLALHTGNGNTEGWEVFCFNQTDTSTETNILPQYILDENGGTYLTARAMQLVKNKHQACSNILKEELTKRRYKEKHDLAALNNGGTYANKYNKQYIAEGRNLDTDPHNGFVFYKNIPEQGGVTYVGYRGDYLTSKESHQPLLKSITAGWSPTSPVTSELYSLWKPGNWEAGKVSFANYAASPYGNAVAENKSDQIAAVGKEFPHAINLNVNRTQPNNIYKTGYAVIEYENLAKLDVDHTGSVSGVTAISPSYKGKNIAGQSDSLRASGNNFTARATYDDAWETPNDVVIFNPSSAEYSRVNEMSEYIPDLRGMGADNDNYPERDQRASGQVATFEDGSTVITGKPDASSDTVTLPTYTYKELKSESLLPTSCYIWDKDYVSAGTGVTKKMVLAANSIISAPTDGDYVLQVYDKDGYATCVSIHLSAKEILVNEAGTIYKKARNAKVTWGQYQTGDIAGGDVEPTVINNTRVDTYRLDNIGTMKAGEVIHLQYYFKDEVPQGSNPFSISMPDVNPTALLNPYMYTANGHVWDCYIEAKEDTSVGELQVHFNITNILEEVPTVLQFEDSFVASTGEARSVPAAQMSSIEWKISETSVNAYNSNMCTYMSAVFTPPVVTAYNCYIQYEEIKEMYRLDYISALNPHIVHNTNWRYYVDGWYTSSGAMISTPSDPKLDFDDTVLRWPYSPSATITVGELRKSAVIVKWNGVVYLTTKEAASERKIMELGQIAEQFDTFTFAGDTTDLSVKRLDGDVKDYQNEGRSHNYEDAFYEWVFECTDGTGADKPVYDVQKSKNLEHKFSKDDTSAALDTSGTVKENWQYDWDVKEETASENEFGWASLRENESTYLSLDDEFSIWFDNKGKFYETNHHNAGYMNVDLGYGWGVDENSEMEVSKWIKDKYMRVEFPYYVFGWNSKYNVPDPTVTYEEYINNDLQEGKHLAGTGIELVYMGTELCHLGYYDIGSCEDCKNGNEQKCNDKHWVDFGEKNGYNYHFWVALSADETRSTTVLLNSVNINNQGNTEENQKSINKNAPPAVYSRFSNAMHKSPQAIVGRVGNLNIIDSGDFRFSDTFKTVKDDAEWLVYGLIRKIDSYSNVKGIPSTQRALLVDPWDVRGVASMPELLDSNVFTSGYITYPNSTESDSNGFSTYQTQWHKSGGATENNDDNGSGDTYIASVPLSGEFNKHAALKLTQQKIGYNNLITLDSIGNYFGENRNIVTQEPADDRSAYDEVNEEVNANHDYHNYKIQVRPYYLAIDTETDKIYPVDVYWKPNGSYEIMNTGSTSTKDWLRVMQGTSYNYYLDGNTKGKGSGTTTYSDGSKSNYDAKYELDENMLRRMVTDLESTVTRSVCDYHGFQSMLDNPQDITDISDKDWGVDEKYCYGNSQFLFLRARNRTFVGKASQALKYDEYPIADYVSHLSHAQKWYFDLGLPASAVFIESGQSFSVEKIIQSEHIFILCCVDVYALGEVWTLHYKSPVSKAAITIDGKTYGGDEWNVVDDLPYLIPVTFYCTGDTTAKGDLTTEGTH